MNKIRFLNFYHVAICFGVKLTFIRDPGKVLIQVITIRLLCLLFDQRKVDEKEEMTPGLRPL